ncbi:hypothetical protein Pyn_00814 [Prunus yedoensis var. nudiflora]|uniref:Uncharacterized protein n=1 Tax=Prunus yedoensis var. nudiflora TaxID=2094558 RepID=A0A314ZG99_PRUYE|nr:hypothetical protein Pyn_00814 [Prunus yedoensis var. nudiflora]
MRKRNAPNTLDCKVEDNIIESNKGERVGISKIGTITTSPAKAKQAAAQGGRTKQASRVKRKARASKKPWYKLW